MLLTTSSLYNIPALTKCFLPSRCQRFLRGHGGPGMRKLRVHIYPVMAPRRNRTLPLQRMRPLSQDERLEPPAD